MIILTYYNDNKLLRVTIIYSELLTEMMLLMAAITYTSSYGSNFYSSNVTYNSNYLQHQVSTAAVLKATMPTAAMYMETIHTVITYSSNITCSSIANGFYAQVCMQMLIRAAMLLTVAMLMVTMSIAAMLRFVCKCYLEHLLIAVIS